MVGRQALWCAQGWDSQLGPSSGKLSLCRARHAFQPPVCFCDPLDLLEAAKTRQENHLVAGGVDQAGTENYHEIARVIRERAPGCILENPRHTSEMRHLAGRHMLAERVANATARSVSAWRFVA